MSALPTVTRPMMDADRHFILSTWLKACRYSLSAKRVPNDHYYHYQQRLIENIWTRATTTVLALAEDDTVILGYLCFEKTQAFPRIIHFAYVKATFQGNGFFKALLKSADIDLDAQETIFTHYTLESAFLKEKREQEKTEQYVTAEVLKHRYPKTVYNPYLAGDL